MINAAASVFNKFENRIRSAIRPAKISSVTIIFVELLHFGEVGVISVSISFFKSVYYNALIISSP